VLLNAKKGIKAMRKRTQSSSSRVSLKLGRKLDKQTEHLDAQLKKAGKLIDPAKFALFRQDTLGEGGIKVGTVAGLTKDEEVRRMTHMAPMTQDELQSKIEGRNRRKSMLGSGMMFSSMMSSKSSMMKASMNSFHNDSSLSHMRRMQRLEVVMERVEAKWVELLAQIEAYHTEQLELQNELSVVLAAKASEVRDSKDRLSFPVAKNK
jgi:hypothetical protein